MSEAWCTAGDCPSVYMDPTTGLPHGLCPHQPDPTTPAAGAAPDARLDCDCKLCGWQFSTINGLWEHIPTHSLTPPQYAALTKDRPELLDRIDALEAELAERTRLGDAMAEALWRMRHCRDHGHVGGHEMEPTREERNATANAWRAFGRRDGGEG